MAAPAVHGFRGIFSFYQKIKIDHGAKIISRLFFCFVFLVTEAFFHRQPQIEGQAAPSLSLAGLSPWSYIDGKERNCSGVGEGKGGGEILAFAGLEQTIKKTARGFCYSRDEQ